MTQQIASRGHRISVQPPVEDLFELWRSAGDPRALAAVFDRTASELWQIARHLSGDRTEADDLLQATFLAAMESAASWRREQPLVPWLLGIMVNALRMLRRRQRRVVPAAALTRRPAEDPAAAAETAELRVLLRQAVERLPEIYRSVLVLQIEHGLTSVEVAAALGRPRATVRSQLQRGLDLLRRTLPLGLAATGRRAEGTPDLREVRGAVLAAAGAGASVPAAAIIGVTIMTKKLIVAAVLLAVTAAWLVWPPPELPKPNRTESVRTSTPSLLEATPPRREPVPEPAASTASVPAPLETTAPRREPVAAPAAAAPALNLDEPVLVEPYRLRVRIVDEAGDGVGGAQVQAWQAKRTALPPGLREHFGGKGSTTGYSGRAVAAAPLAGAPADADGHCAIEIDREAVVVAATKDGHESGDVMAWHSKHRDGAVLEIELAQSWTLRGIVLRGDDTPAVDVEVKLTVQGGSVLGSAGMQRRPASVRSDAEGRFTFPIHKQLFYGVWAYDDGESAFPVGVDTVTRQGDQDVVVRFPGALSVRGMVLDWRGQPFVGAKVRVSEQPELAADMPWNGSGESGSDGRFRVDVPRHARYWALANGSGHATSRPVTTDVSAATPHAEITICLERAAAIAGVVRYESGAPASGVTLMLQPETGDDDSAHYRPKRDDLFAPIAPVKADADGAFRFEGAHPGTTWLLYCVPDVQRPSVHVRMLGVRPGTEDLVFVLDDVALRGTTLHGRVFDPAGRPTDAFRLKFVRYEGDRVVGSQDITRAEIADGRFTIPAVSIGTRLGLLVEPHAAAAVFLGPIETRAENAEFTVNLRAFAEVTCRVVRADGRPARRVFVVASLKERLPMGGGGGGAKTDDDGVAQFAKLAPGAHEFAVLENMLDKIAPVEVDLLSGANPEVTLRLPQ